MGAKMKTKYSKKKKHDHKKVDEIREKLNKYWESKNG